MGTITSRRQFLHSNSSIITASAMLSSIPINKSISADKRIKIGVIGCGSVSNSYLPHLTKCPYAEVVSVCDIKPERAVNQAKKFNIPNHYPHIDQLLAGADFELMITLTDMQEHERLNKQALEAGKHVWSEKPMANSLAGGQALLALAKKKGLRIWGAPAMVLSKQFEFMARAAQQGKLGRIAAAHAQYGHTGPDWSSFFYEKGGGSLPDLAVYNLTTVTGILGPAKSITAMTSIVTPARNIHEKGEIKVETEDNAMVLMEHRDGIISHVQSGFNYYNPYGHDGSQETRHTVAIVGSKGYMGLVGYDWDPQGVEMATDEQPNYERHLPDKGEFVWQMGASYIAECMATGKEPMIQAEHSLHVLEIMQAIHQSQNTGKRISLQSTFNWPYFS